MSESSADTLRRAAKVLGEHAEAATEGPWENVAHDVYETHSAHGDVVAEAGLAPSDARYIALVDPTVGLALADWLGSAAIQAEEDERAAKFRTVSGDWRTFVRYHHLVGAALPTARAVLREDAQT